MQVESNIRLLSAVLNDIQLGKIRVPQLQRQFVWSSEQMLKLLDSIRRGYPIGSVLLWETEDRFPSREEVGPIHVGAPPPHGAVSYLLDGQQRLTTLLGCLFLPEGEKRRLKWRVAYDASEDRFKVMGGRPTSSDLPVRLFPDGFATSTFLGKSGMTEGQFRSAQNIASSFLNYQLPVIKLVNASLEDAVDVFGRLNSLGKGLTAPELAAALSYGRASSRPFDLYQGFRDILEQLVPFGLQDLSQTTLLRALIAGLGELNIFDSDLSAIVDRHRSHLDSALDELRKSLLLAAQFLRSRIGISGSKVLPYGLQIVLLSELFRANSNPPPGVLDAVSKWIWNTSFTSAYAVGNSKYFNTAIQNARAGANGMAVHALSDLKLRALPYPGVYHGRSARVRAFLLFLKSLKPLNPSDGTLLAQETLLANGFSDTARVFQSNELTYQLSNRLLVGSAFVSDVRHTLLTLAANFPQKLQATLSSHVISDRAWKALCDNKSDEFNQLRRDDLIREERKFLESHGLELSPIDLNSDEELEQPIEAADEDFEGES